MCSMEHPQTHPSSRYLSKPLCIQGTFSTSKIWYRCGLPPVSLWETELAGFLIERSDCTDCKRLLWCVCFGAWDGLWLYPNTVGSCSPQRGFRFVLSCFCSLERREIIVHFCSDRSSTSRLMQLEPSPYCSIYTCILPFVHSTLSVASWKLSQLMYACMSVHAYIVMSLAVSWMAAFRHRRV